MTRIGSRNNDTRWQERQRLDLDRRLSDDRLDETRRSRATPEAPAHPNPAERSRAQEFVQSSHEPAPIGSSSAASELASRATWARPDVELRGRLSAAERSAQPPTSTATSHGPGEATSRRRYAVQDPIGDHLHGGPGSDLIIGGSGHDRIRGGRGADLIIGGEGDDRIRGGRGADLIIGGEGDDRIRGRRGADALAGGQGRDVLIGGAGRDDLFGGRGSDVLADGRGSDRLRGGRGNDVLQVGAGDNVIRGGAGYDVASFRGDPTDYQIRRREDGSFSVTDRTTGDRNIVRGVEAFSFVDDREA